MTYSDAFNIRTTSVKFNDVADAIDGSISRAFGGTTTGTSTAYIAAPLPAWTSYDLSSSITIIPHVTNTAGSPSVTINISGLGTRTIKRAGSDLVAGVLLANIPMLLIYNGTNFELIATANSLLVDGSNTMAANLNFGSYRPIGINAGTAAAPAICLNNDSNTGIFAPAADTWAVATNGSERLRIDSAGQILGGISGTAAAPAICLNNDSNTGIFAPAADTWAVAANGAEVARITTTGLGVQTAPSVALHAVGNTTFRGTANTIAAFQAATGATNDACLMIGSTNGNTPFIEASKLNGGAGSATSLHIKTDNTTRVTVNATGEVGIGTSSIGGNLDVRTPYADADDFVVGVNLSPGNYYFKSKLIGRHTTAGGSAVVIDAGHIVQKQMSSLKYKTDVQDYLKGLVTVKQLRPVQYKGINDGDKIFAGLIAEEVHEAGLTEFVVYDSNNEPEALAYGNMVALAFKAIQELNAKVEALEAQLV